MSATVLSIDEVGQDYPIPLLSRRMVRGEQMLWAHVELKVGCDVAMHQHESEQIAYVISGRVIWRFGEPDTDEYREQEVAGGTVVHLPGNLPHGVMVIEDSVILDVLSPPGLMGVDHQDS
ncbi:MAG: cupin domain-containing protein [Armatimonadota bacterium]|nr:cupin domain-containing protein [Armatimonadota bacterium]